jgi:hypothetical protein
VSNIVRSDDDYQDKNGYVLAVYVKLDKQYEVVTRKVSDVLTLLAAIGGLQKTLFAIGMIVVTFVAQKVFMANIIKQIY